MLNQRIHPKIPQNVLFPVNIPSGKWLQIPFEEDWEEDVLMGLPHDSSKVETNLSFFQGILYL